MTKNDDDGGRRVRPFADFLLDMSRGHSHAELSEGLQTLTAAVLDTGKKGTLTYRLTVAVMKDGRTLAVGDEIALKLPEHDRAGSIFWADNDHNLTRSDPNQRALFGPVRTVPSSVDPETGEITGELA